MNGTSKKILLVEDEPIARTVYQTRLQREGFEISFVEDGEQALTFLSKTQPDLVTLDLMLPKVNGAEVLKQIRSDERLKNTPVLVISNAYMMDLSQKALESGATRGMSKTECTPAKLVETVRDMLGMGSAFDLSDKPVSDEEQAKAFALAAESAMADEMMLKETREEFLQKAAVEVARIRELSLAYVKAGAAPANQEPLNGLYQQVRFFATRAGLSGCVKIALLSNAFEALLFETLFKPAKASPSASQTIAQAVDCLERLCQDKNGKICDSMAKSKILVVDDEPICNYAVVSALKRAHFEPESSEDPLKALQMAEAGRYDVVFLDINMPGLNGFEVCERLRALPQYKETPVIFITSNADFQHRAQSILSGGNDFIPKPVSPVELVLKTTMRLIRPQGLVEKAATTGSSQPLNIFAPKETTEPTAAPLLVPELAIPAKEVAKDEPAPIKMEPLRMAAPEIEMPKPSREMAPPGTVNPEKVSEPESHGNGARNNGASNGTIENLHLAKPETEVPSPAPVIEAPKLEQLEQKIEPPVPAPTPAEPEKLTMSSVEAVKEAPQPAPAPVEDKKELPPVEAKAPEIKAPEVPLPQEEIKAPEPKAAEAPVEIKNDLPLPEIKVPEAPTESKAPEAPVELKASETPLPPEPKAVEVPPPVESKPLETSPKINLDEPSNKVVTMETKTKPTFEEAARGVARIIFGDDNITDMNVRLTRIALERYNVPSTQSIDEVARGVTQIIFGEGGVSDMNVRLTRIALESYNVTELLGLNGAKKPAEALVSL